MNKDWVCCNAIKTVADVDGSVADFICQGLDINKEELLIAATLGFFCGEKLIGGVVFGEYREKTDIWLTIYTTDKRWCSRKILKIIFNFAFNILSCRRINALISTDNFPSLYLAQRLGFQKEGMLRQYRENGQDVYILGMLKKECKFI